MLAQLQNNECFRLHFERALHIPGSGTSGHSYTCQPQAIGAYRQSYTISIDSVTIITNTNNYFIYIGPNSLDI